MINIIFSHRILEKKKFIEDQMSTGEVLNQEEEMRCED